MITPEELFNLLSNETRLRCLLLLSREKEICVCEFSHILECSQPKISRHLACLRKSGLVSVKRRGQWVYYRLERGLLKWAQQIVANIAKELEDVGLYRSDFEKLHTRQHLCSK